MFTSTDKSCFQPETEKPYLAVAKVIVKIHGKMLKLKKKLETQEQKKHLCYPFIFKAKRRLQKKYKECKRQKVGRN